MKRAADSSGSSCQNIPFVVGGWDFLCHQLICNICGRYFQNNHRIFLQTGLVTSVYVLLSDLLAALHSNHMVGCSLSGVFKHAYPLSLDDTTKHLKSLALHYVLTLNIILPLIVTCLWLKHKLD